jgi:hypothetical protein
MRSRRFRNSSPGFIALMEPGGAFVQTMRAATDNENHVADGS